MLSPLRRCLLWLVAWGAVTCLGDSAQCVATNADCLVREESVPESLRVELLQTGHAHVAGTRSAFRPESSLIKSTVAVSERSIGISMEWKLNNLRVDMTGEPDFPDGCGKSGRVTMFLGNKDVFGVHGVFATGAHMDRDGLEDLYVEQVEDIATAKLGDFSSYSPWMDFHFAFYDEDLDWYAERWNSSGTNFLALTWQSQGASSTNTFYSLITHVPGTMEIFEAISINKPHTPMTFQHHEMPRHGFSGADVNSFTQGKYTMAQPLHVSRSTRDLPTVIAFYKEMFGIDPVATDYDHQTDEGYAFFEHSPDQLPPKRQVHYWHRGNQHGLYTTDWLEEKLEGINEKYMLGGGGGNCWPVWGDNHYTIQDPPSGFFANLTARYNAKRLGYKVFRSGTHSPTPSWTPEQENQTFAAYFPLPGGWYVELHDEQVDAAEADEWVPDYCYTFSCR